MIRCNHSGAWMLPIDPMDLILEDWDDAVIETAEFVEISPVPSEFRRYRPVDINGGSDEDA